MFYKLMIALLVIAGLAPFTFIKGKDGKPLMSFSDIKMPDSSIPDIKLPDLETKDNAVQDGTVFKWKDQNGIWQFSSEPPPKGLEFSSTVYDSNMNVIQAVETKRTEAKKNMLEIEDKEPTKDVPGITDAYSPEKVEKLFDDAKNLDKLLGDRVKEQNEILNNL